MRTSWEISTGASRLSLYLGLSLGGSWEGEVWAGTQPAENWGILSAFVLSWRHLEARRESWHSTESHCFFWGNCWHSIFLFLEGVGAEEGGFIDRKSAALPIAASVTPSAEEWSFLLLLSLKRVEIFLLPVPIVCFLRPKLASQLELCVLNLVGVGGAVYPADLARLTAKVS